MSYTLEGEIGEIANDLKSEGYKIVKSCWTTTHVKDKEDKVINAYTEPIRVVMTREDTTLDIEFYSTIDPERTKNRKLIKAIQINPETKSPREVIASMRILSRLEI